MEKTAVTCVCWVPRGKCKTNREDQEPDEDELREAEEFAARAKSGSGAKGSTDGLEEFDMDNYDEEDDGGLQFFSTLKEDGELAREKDPQITGDPDSESDSDDYYEIRPQDSVFVAASCEEDSCMLEMYVYDEDEANMYVHHDVSLGAYPLCIDWLGSTSSVAEGNFCCVGLIDHSIELWDLDRLDPVYPAMTLGTAKVAKEKKGIKKRSRRPKGEVKAHDGPVLCLHGNTFTRNVLASGSGDQKLKVWDVSQNTCIHSYAHHSDKVQVVKWHPTEEAVMLSASFDRRLALLDVRRPGEVAMVALPGEAECATWSRHKPFECFASSDDGRVVCYDVRKVASQAPDNEKVLWTLQAHDVACTSVNDTPTKNMLITTSLDGIAKVWSLKDAIPSMVFSKDLQAGPLFTCSSNPDEPAVVSFGGKCPVIWDLSSEDLLAGAFDFGGSRS